MKNNALTQAKFFVYILHSQQYDKYYIGHTHDLVHRLSQHNAPANHSYTSRYKPWSLLCQFIFETRTEAMAFEQFLKNKHTKDFLYQLCHDLEYQAGVLVKFKSAFPKSRT